MTENVLCEILESQGKFVEDRQWENTGSAVSAEEVQRQRHVDCAGDSPSVNRYLSKP